MCGVYLWQVHRGIAWRLMQQGANTTPGNNTMYARGSDSGSGGKWEVGKREAGPHHVHSAVEPVPLLLCVTFLVKVACSSLKCSSLQCSSVWCSSRYVVTLAASAPLSPRWLSSWDTAHCTLASSTDLWRWRREASMGSEAHFIAGNDERLKVCCHESTIALLPLATRLSSQPCALIDRYNRNL